jgi:hypothetical protein
VTAVQTVEQTASRSRGIAAHGDLSCGCLVSSGEAPGLYGDSKPFAYFCAIMLWKTSRWETNTEEVFKYAVESTYHLLT